MVVRVATLNALFDAWRGRPYKPRVVRSARRYAALTRVLEALDADVIALNEVTATLRDALASAGWVRDGYTLSAAPDVDRAFGNLILSRLPVAEAYPIALPRLRRRALCAIVEPAPGERLAVCAAHLTAHAREAPRRAAQLSALAEALGPIAAGCRDALILGDLNLHADAEDAAIPSGWTDLWPLLTDAPGYTFDAHRNPMLMEMWPLGFETRRMRLDRVLARDGGALTPRSIALFADAPIAGPPSPVGAPRLAARLGAAIAQALGREREPTWLRLSDHFGIVVDLEG